jgi:hypothetical protein
MFLVEIFNVSFDGRQINVLLENDILNLYYYDEITKDFMKKELGRFK